MGFEQLAAVFGPTTALVVFMWLNRDKTPKEDSGAKLTELVASIDKRLIKIETIVERLEDR